MRRGLVFIAIGALLFVAATIGGFVWSARSAPEWVRAQLERQLSEASGVDVTLGAVRLGIRGGIRLVFERARIGPTEAGAAARATRIRAWLDPVALVLRGKLRVDAVEARDAEIVLPPHDPSGPDVLEQALALAAAVREGPVRRIELHEARVVGAGEAPELVLSGLSGTARRGLVRSGVDLSLEATLGEEGGRVRLEGRTATDATELSLALEDVRLERLPDAIRNEIPIDHATGVLDGTVGWQAAPETAHRFEIALTGRRVAGRLPGEPLAAFALARPSFSAVVHSGPGAVAVEDAVLRDGGPPIAWHLRWPRGEGDRGRVRLGLETADLGVAQARDLLERLPLALSAEHRERLAALDAGRIVRLEATLDTTRAGLREMTRRDLMARPGDLVAEVELAEVGLRLGSDLLTGLSGSLRYDGDRLAVHTSSARLGEQTLPGLEGELRGLSNLRGADELRCRAPQPTADTPGLLSFVHWLRSHKKEPRVPGWHRLRVEADWISHPLLLCGAEQVVGSLVPATRGAELEIERAVWAGVALSGKARIHESRERALERVVFDVVLGSAFEPMALVPPNDPWARGRLSWDGFRLGRWRVLGAHGAFRLSGGELRLDDVVLDLDPSGSLRGEVAVDLARPEALAYRASLRGERLDLTDFASALRMRDPGRLTGTLRGEARFSGTLVPGRQPLARAGGTLELHARDGRVARDMPILMALLLADSPFDPIRDLEELSYTTFDATARLEDGAFVSDDAVLDGPTVRMVASGRVEVEGPHRLEAVLGVLLFPNLDSLIDQFPLLDRLILGRNRNLIGAYYAFEGPFSEPDASLVPVKSLTAGPASFVLEDIPGFVWGGLKRIQSMLIPGRAELPAPAPQAEAPLRADS